MTIRMKLRFNEAKAAQAAARLLKLAGGKLNYVSLVKLLYIVDRTALLKWGRPVTTDQYVSMDKGPVVSKIYDLITDEPDVRTPWYALISPPANFEVSLRVDEPPSDELSRAEEQLLERVFADIGKKNRFQLIEICHKFPEWRDPEGSAIPFDYKDILAGAQKSAEEIAAIVEELGELATVQAITPRRA